MLFLMSRHQSSCRDITLCCCRLHWLFMMSRLQIFCRDITSLISAPSLATYVVILVATCCIRSFNYLEVVTSQQGCAHSKTASMSQLFASISASIIDCIFIHLLLHFPSFLSLLVNDKLVSFFIFLYINYSFLDENQTEKWTKKR